MLLAFFGNRNRTQYETGKTWKRHNNTTSTEIKLVVWVGGLELGARPCFMVGL